MTFADVVALHLRLDGAVVDQQTLGGHYDRLCAGGTPLACKWRAWDAWGRVKPDGLLRILDGACTAGDPTGCAVLGVALASSNPTRAAGLLRPACDAGSGRACLELARLTAADGEPAAAEVLRVRACSLGVEAGCAPVAIDPATGCAAGRTRSCEDWLPTATGPDRLRALEQLCHAEVRCEELAAARAAGDRGALVAGRPVSRATWIEGGVLLGWDATTFVDHAFVPIADLDHVELVIGGSRDEHFVLTPLSGEPIVLPDLGCDPVLAGTRLLAAAGKLVRAREADGAPTSSQCIEALAPTTVYRTGRLVVDAKSGEENAAAAVRASIAADIDGMWRCAEAAPFESHLDAWTATLTHAKEGPAARVAQTASSGDAAFDDCVAAWLSAVELGPASYKTQHPVRVSVGW